MWYFIKNNVKLIYRSRVLFFMLILLPILLIALLSDTFSNYLETNKKLESFRAGYSCGEDSFIMPMLDELSQVCTEQGISLTSLDTETGIQNVKDGTLDTFVNFRQNDYVLYQGNDTVACGMLLDSLVATFALAYRQQLVTEGNGMKLTQMEGDPIEVQKVAVDPIPDAKTYYGIVEILYMMWCGIISIAAIFISEQKHKMKKRYDICTTSSSKLYFGKLFAGTIALCIQMGTAIAISVAFLDIDWGNVFYKSVGILFLQAVAVSSVSILLYQVFRYTAVVLAVDFFFAFISGFLGGSFQTYMYSTVGHDIAKWSPQYYLNRTLVEFATKGQSDYTFICISILGGLVLGCSGLNLLLLKRRREA